MEEHNKGEGMCIDKATLGQTITLSDCREKLNE